MANAPVSFPREDGIESRQKRLSVDVPVSVHRCFKTTCRACPPPPPGGTSAYLVRSSATLPAASRITTGASLRVILSIRSAPSPFEVVIYRAPSGSSIGARSRPKAPSSSATTTWLTKAPSGVNSKRRSLLSFSVATARRPSQTPHWAPSRKMAPLAARVGDPFVVAGHWIPAVVAPGDRQVDLVVSRRAVLHQPHLARSRSESQALHVPITIGGDR